MLELLDGLLAKDRGSKTNAIVFQCTGFPTKIWKTQSNTLHSQHLISARIGRSRYLHYKKDARRLLYGSLLFIISP